MDFKIKLGIGTISDSVYNQNERCWHSTCFKIVKKANQSKQSNQSNITKESTTFTFC